MPSTAGDRIEQVGEQGPDADVVAGLAGGEGEVPPVGVDVLAQQGDLGDAVGGEPADLGHDVVDRPADLGAAHGGHDAEGAGVVAADLDRDPGRVGELTPGGQGARELGVVLGGRRLEDLGDRTVGPGAVQQLDGPGHVVGADHDVDVRRPGPDLVAVLLGQAAGDDDLHAGMRVLDRLEVAEVAVEAVVGVLPDAAGVEHHHVGDVVAAGAHQAVGLEQAGDALAVVLVHLAPVGAGSSRCGPTRLPRLRGASPDRAAGPGATGDVRPARTGRWSRRRGRRG